MSINNELKPVNFGMYIGLGLEYYFIGRSALVFGLRYNYGFSNTIETKHKEDGNYNLNTFGFIFGIVY